MAGHDVGPLAAVGGDGGEGMAHAMWHPVSISGYPGVTGVHSNCGISLVARLDRSGGEAQHTAVGWVARFTHPEPDLPRHRPGREWTTDATHCFSTFPSHSTLLSSRNHLLSNTLSTHCTHLFSLTPLISHSSPLLLVPANPPTHGPSSKLQHAGSLSSPGQLTPAEEGQSER